VFEGETSRRAPTRLGLSHGRDFDDLFVMEEKLRWELWGVKRITPAFSFCAPLEFFEENTH